MEKKFIRPSEKDKKGSDVIKKSKEHLHKRDEGKVIKKVIKPAVEKDKVSPSGEKRIDKTSPSPEKREQVIEDKKPIRKKIRKRIRTSSGEIIIKEVYVTEGTEPEKRAEGKNLEKKSGEKKQEIRSELKEDVKKTVSSLLPSFKKKEPVNPEEELSIKEWFSKKATDIKPVKKIEDKPAEVKESKKVEDKPAELKESKKVEDKPAEVKSSTAEKEQKSMSPAILSPSDRSSIEYLDKCLMKIIELGASDLHLSIGHSPMIRCRGELQNIEFPVFTKEIANLVLNTILSEKDRKELEENLNLDFAYIMETDGPPIRFRSNAYYHRSGLNIVMRIIPNRIPHLRELGMPDIVGAFGRFKQGLILVTGSSGSGKTSTLTALIDLINTERNAHIITIEDPIEFIHKPKKCIVRQRQVGVHTKNYNRALKASMRENPDIILVSELRDLETIQLAMTAAETGCLVLSTMNTTSAARTIDRIIDSFPPDQRIQSGAMLSDSLRGILSQQLISSIDHSARYAAVEVLVGCTPLASLIREQKTYQINSLLETSKGLGMQSMDSSLLELLKNNLISPVAAYEAAVDKSLFDEYVKK